MYYTYVKLLIHLWYTIKYQYGIDEIEHTDG